MTNLGKHMLPLVLVVHVHAGEEDIPVTVNLGNFEELGVGDDVIRHSNSPQFTIYPNFAYFELLLL